MKNSTFIRPPCQYWMFIFGRRTIYWIFTFGSYVSGYFYFHKSIRYCIPAWWYCFVGIGSFVAQIIACLCKKFITHFYQTVNIAAFYGVNWFKYRSSCGFTVIHASFFIFFFRFFYYFFSLFFYFFLFFFFFNLFI